MNLGERAAGNREARAIVVPVGLEQLHRDEQVEGAQVLRDLAHGHVERRIEALVHDTDRPGDRLALGGDVATRHRVVRLGDELARALEEHVDEAVGIRVGDGRLGAELAIGLGGTTEGSEHRVPAGLSLDAFCIGPPSRAFSGKKGFRRLSRDSRVAPHSAVGIWLTAASEPFSCARLASSALYWRIRRASMRVRRSCRRSSRFSKISRRARSDSVAVVIAPSVPSMPSSRSRTWRPMPRTPPWMSLAASSDCTFFGSASATESLSSETFSDPSRWISMPASESRERSRPSTEEPMIARSLDCIMVTVWLPCRAPAVFVAGS